MQEIVTLISEEEHSECDAQMFMGEIMRYAAITELDKTVLNRLINRILIGKPKKAEGVKTQEVGTVKILHYVIDENNSQDITVKGYALVPLLFLKFIKTVGNSLVENFSF